MARSSCACRRVGGSKSYDGSLGGESMWRSWSHDRSARRSPSTSGWQLSSTPCVSDHRVEDSNEDSDCVIRLRSGLSPLYRHDTALTPESIRHSFWTQVCNQ